MLWRIFTHQCALVPIRTLIKPEILSKMPFYAVAKGRTPGIFMTWPDCEAQVKGFPGARYEKFENIGAAQDFITSEGGARASQKNKSSGSSSTTPINQNDYNHIPNKKVKSKSKESTNSEDDSDRSTAANTMLLKQMFHIEKRLKAFGKAIEKIIKDQIKSSDCKSILIEDKNFCSALQLDLDEYVQVDRDEACSANGRSGARAGLAVHDGHPLNISEPVSGRATNNCGEIQDATCAIKLDINQEVL